MRKPLNLTGKRFNKWLVIKKVENNKWGQSMWLCQCDCGKMVITMGGDLNGGYTKSCGCLIKEILIKRNTKMGILSKGKKVPKIYETWLGMKKRCQNHRCKGYKYWGERGIKICDRWQSFENFYKDMNKSMESHIKEFGERNTTIDRIDNDGNYCKENCRWATQKEQANNRRRRNTALNTTQSMI